MRKLHNISLCAILLLLFTTSCNRPNNVQGEENSDLIEQMREIAPLRLSNPDSVHILLDAMWAENGYRMTYREKVAFYNLRGITYSVVRKFEAAETNLRKALQYLEKLDIFHIQQAIILLNIGNIQADMGKFQNALDAYQQARALFGNLYNPEQRITLYLGKGGVFAQIGEVDSALYYIQLAIDIATKENLQELKMYSFNRLAFLFFSTGQYLQAEENLRRAILVSTEFNNPRGLWYNYSNMVIALILQDRLEESLFYAQKADEIAANLGLPQVAMAPYYSRKGQIYLAENNYRNSLAMHYRVLELQTMIQDTNGITSAKNAIGLAYIGMGNFDKAFFYVNNALKTA